MVGLATTLVEHLVGAGTSAPSSSSEQAGAGTGSSRMSVEMFRAKGKGKGAGMTPEEMEAHYAAKGKWKGKGKSKPSEDPVTEEDATDEAEESEEDSQELDPIEEGRDDDAEDGGGAEDGGETLSHPGTARGGGTSATGTPATAKTGATTTVEYGNATWPETPEDDGADDAAGSSSDAAPGTVEVEHAARVRANLELNGPTGTTMPLPTVEEETPEGDIATVNEEVPAGNNTVDEGVTADDNVPEGNDATEENPALVENEATADDEGGTTTGVNLLLHVRLPPRVDRQEGEHKMRPPSPPTRWDQRPPMVPQQQMGFQQYGGGKGGGKAQQFQVQYVPQGLQGQEARIRIAQMQQWQAICKLNAAMGMVPPRPVPTCLLRPPRPGFGVPGVDFSLELQPLQHEGLHGGGASSMGSHQGTTSKAAGAGGSTAMPMPRATGVGRRKFNGIPPRDNLESGRRRWVYSNAYAEGNWCGETSSSGGKANGITATATDDGGANDYDNGNHAGTRGQIDHGLRRVVRPPAPSDDPEVVQDVGGGVGAEASVVPALVAQEMMEGLKCPVSDRVALGTACQCGEEKCEKSSFCYALQKDGTATCQEMSRQDPSLLDLYGISKVGPRDGKDVGQINGRELKFHKKSASSGLRFFYSDNFRVYTGYSAARWELKVDGASCPSGMMAQDLHVIPGENPHRINGFGFHCKGVGKGNHKVTVHVGPSPGYEAAGRHDSYTGYGWGGDAAWHLEAQEIPEDYPLYHFKSGVNGDAKDSGVVHGRTLKFKKLYKDDSRLRLFYSDNLRAHSHGYGACRWIIRVDGQACKSGNIAGDVYVHPGDNPHRPRSFVGYCDDVSVGEHTVDVFIDHTPGYTCDGWTGWHPTGGAQYLLEAEEIPNPTSYPMLHYKMAHQADGRDSGVLTHYQLPSRKRVRAGSGTALIQLFQNQ
eukprot:s4033_g1.t1